MDNSYRNSIQFVKDYIEHQNNLMKTDIYKALSNYKFTEKELYENKICLDNFNIYSEKQNEIANKFSIEFDNDICIDNVINTNINFKFDFAIYINASSCYELSSYLFKLIHEIKKDNFNEIDENYTFICSYCSTYCNEYMGWKCEKCKKGFCDNHNIDIYICNCK